MRSTWQSSHVYPLIRLPDHVFADHSAGRCDIHFDSFANTNRRQFIGAAANSALATSVAFDPAFGTAIAAGAAIRGKKVSSVELTRHAFERIAKLNPDLNAVIVQFHEEAMQAARTADGELPRRRMVRELDLLEFCRRS
ncbi:MAG: hypothetical protein ACJ74Z_23495 [Bryobacteraceae bacterium]|jgi:hypothetical protein